jgi:hypothetical protein
LFLFHPFSTLGFRQFSVWPFDRLTTLSNVEGQSPTRQSRYGEGASPPETATRKEKHYLTPFDRLTTLSNVEGQRSQGTQRKL